MALDLMEILVHDQPDGNRSGRAHELSSCDPCAFALSGFRSPSSGPPWLFSALGKQHLNIAKKVPKLAVTVEKTQNRINIDLPHYQQPQ